MDNNMPQQDNLDMQNNYQAPVQNIDVSMQDNYQAPNQNNNMPMQQNYQAPVQNYNMPMPGNNIPEEYKPLGAWKYFGCTLLFCLPLIGFIMLIVFAVSNKNINRRNYARGYLLMMVFAVLFTIILTVVFGASLSSMNLS